MGSGLFGFRFDSISVTTSGDVSCLTSWSLPESLGPELEQSRRMASLKMLLNTINGFATEMLFVPSALPFTHEKFSRYHFGVHVFTHIRGVQTWDHRLLKEKPNVNRGCKNYGIMGDFADLILKNRGTRLRKAAATF